MDMMAWKEFLRKSKMNRKLQLTIEHAKQQEAMTLQKLEHGNQHPAIEPQNLVLQIRASETLFTVV